MSSQTSSDPPSWESAQRTFEGFPLYLRRPKGLDFDKLSERFPVHLTVTHEFSFRRLDGAPEPTYNDGLEKFDLSLTDLFSHTADGQVVLVETFGGKRHYYFYVAQNVHAESVLEELRSTFPGYKLEAAVRPDPSWSFIRRYTKEHLGEA